MSDEKPAATSADGKPHRHWDKLVSAAYLRMMGATQEEAAQAVGRAERTVRSWEADGPVWNLAREEARSRWLVDLEDASRQAVLKVISQGHASMAFQVLERIDPNLSPKQTIEHRGDKGGPIQIEVTRRIVRADGDG